MNLAIQPSHSALRITYLYSITSINKSLAINKWPRTTRILDYLQVNLINCMHIFPASRITWPPSNLNLTFWSNDQNKHVWQSTGHQWVTWSSLSSDTYQSTWINCMHIYIPCKSNNPTAIKLELDVLIQWSKQTLLTLDQCCWLIGTHVNSLTA